jgi:hypothetical protein
MMAASFGLVKFEELTRIGSRSNRQPAASELNTVVLCSGAEKSGTTDCPSSAVLGRDGRRSDRVSRPLFASLSLACRRSQFAHDHLAEQFTGPLGRRVAGSLGGRAADQVVE